jgi:hypothetical protein
MLLTFYSLLADWTAQQLGVTGHCPSIQMSSSFLNPNARPRCPRLQPHPRPRPHSASLTAVLSLYFSPL